MLGGSSGAEGRDQLDGEATASARLAFRLALALLVSDAFVRLVGIIGELVRVEPFCWAPARLPSGTKLKKRERR